MAEPVLTLVKVTDLHTDPKNPRRITDREMDRLRRSLRDDPDFMRLRPILARPDGSIYAGNMRFEAAKAEGWDEVPAIITDDPEGVLKQRAVKDNTQFGEWVEEELAEYLSELATEVPDLDFEALGLPDDTVRIMGLEEEQGLMDATQGINAGFGASERAEKAVDGASTSDGRTKPNFRDDDATLENVSDELPGAFQLGPDLKYRMGLNAWDVPMLREEMLIETLPAPMMCWSDQKTTPPQDDRFYLWNYGLAPAAGLPGDRAVLCFYTYDHYFENWFSLPHFYTTKALNIGIKMAVVPDFSIYGDMPRALRMLQVWRAQWMGRYFQEAGIKVIPRINPGPESDWDWSLLGIPKNAPVVATCYQTSFSKVKDKDTGQEIPYEELVEYSKAGFQHAMDTIRPGSLLNYGGPPAHRAVNEWLKEMDMHIPVMHVLNYSAVRRHVAFDSGASHTDSARRDNPNVGMERVAVPEVS